MFKSKPVNYLLLIISAAILLILGYFVGRNSNENSEGLGESPAAGIRETGYLYISPLLECEYGENIQDKNLSPVKNQVDSKVKKLTNEDSISTMSVYFRDLNNGPWFEINGGELYTPASLLKVPLMFAFLKYAEVDPSILDEQIIFSEELFTDQHGGFSLLPEEYQPKEKLKIGESYAALDIAERMLEYSDNNAFNLLASIVSSRALLQVHQDLGIPFPDASTPEDYITVKTYASLFRVLYNSSYLTRFYSEMALEMLSKVTFDIGITSGVPADVVVSNKFGIRSNSNGGESFQLHDCGIVYYPDHPYLLCIMTKGEDIDKMSSAIAQISKLIYTELDSRYSSE